MPTEMSSALVAAFVPALVSAPVFDSLPTALGPKLFDGGKISNFLALLPISYPLYSRSLADISTSLSNTVRHTHDYRQLRRLV